MTKIKVLNLYAGIGGNRKLWENVEVTAVEYEPPIAKAYQHFFPNDKMIIGDAHKYLLKHYKEFDFIWASPPCPTHSVLGYCGMKKMEKFKDGNTTNCEGTKEIDYPDMRLYQEIIFLKHFFKGKWVVENTFSYYNPLIKPFISGSHYFWSNFIISNLKINEPRPVSVNSMEEKQKLIGFNLDGLDFSDMKSSHKKDKVLHNCVHPKLGLHIFNCAFKDKQQILGGFEKEIIVSQNNTQAQPLAHK